MIHWRLAAATFLLAGTASVAHAQVGANTGRLPTDVTPVHYDMTIDPDAKAMRFAGEETVTVLVAKPVSRIVLNAADLTVDKASLDGNVQAKVSLDADAQTLTLDFAQPVSAGTHRIAISFQGKINESAAGLFAVDYNDPDGPKRMLVTQFEAADGRRFAPMWDEPARKATFTLTAAAPAGQIAFSNMPIASTAKRADGKTLVTFQQTPKMSSYLLFLGMGDLVRKTMMSGKTEIGIITRKGAAGQGDYALASASRILTYYNDYFGTPYPLPKMDMIAAPGSSQFFSAMENWGAILYFDRAVLVDPKLTTESGRQTVFTVVAHEMAHQWFGDLVTMRWWDDLWLNEGFASWMESKAADQLNPSWNALAQDVAFSRQAALSTDARASTHPIVQKILTVDQISQAFDTITYQKGQATIRMIEAAIGPDAFRAGVRSYMAKYKYGNTQTDDLWAELSTAAGRPVKPFADTFTLQGGVPLIREGAMSCAGGTTKLSLSQERFALDAPSKAPRRWIVPVTLTAGGTPTTVDVSGPQMRAASAPGCGLLVVNPGQQGYYRTLPTDAHFAALQAGFAQLGLSDQVGLIGDSLAFADSGDAKLDRYLGLLDKVPAGSDPLVWDLVASQLSGIDQVLDGDPVLPAFRRKAIALLAPAFARVGFEAKQGEAPAVSQLREQLIASLGRFGDPKVVDTARQLVAGGIERLPAAIREPVIGVYAYNATPAEWDNLHQLALNEKDPGAKRSLYASLASPADPVLAQKGLDLALTDELSVPNRANLIGGVSRQHAALAFDWAVAHADKVNALIEASSQPGYIVNLAARATDAGVADRVKAYAAKAIPEKSRQNAETSENGIRYRARLRAERSGPIAAWAKGAMAAQ
jgi:aminopeptidase N